LLRVIRARHTMTTPRPVLKSALKITTHPQVLAGLLAALLAAPATSAFAQEAAPANPPATSPAAPAAPEAPATTAPAPATPQAPAQAAPASEEAVIASTKAYNEGLAALKKDDLVGARSSFERVVALAPKDALAQMFLGYVRFKQSQLDDALSALLIAQSNEVTLSPQARGALYTYLGLVYWGKKQPEPAITAYRKALVFDKESPDARYNLAVALLDQRQFKEALPLLTALVQKSPSDAALQDALGLAYERTGQWNLALQTYKKAIALDPRNATYPLNMALALERSGRKAEAPKYLRMAITADPQNTEALLRLGEVFIAQARWGEAQDTFSKYVALKPNDFFGWYNLGVAHDYSAKFDDALRSYARAAELLPNDANVKNNVGRILYKRGKLDEALASLRDSLRLDPSNLDARYNLGLVLAAQNKPEEAAKEWASVISTAQAQVDALRPKGDEAKKKSLLHLLVVSRGAVAENYLKAEKWSEAEAELGLLLKADPDNIPALTNRGFALYHLGRNEQAEKAYRDLIVQDKENALAYNNLGAVLEARNKRAEALRMYRRALELKPDYTEAKTNIDRLTAAAAVG
jgi:tetratricopeptide (TPR) repeat protein